MTGDGRGVGRGINPIHNLSSKKWAKPHLMNFLFILNKFVVRPNPDGQRRDPMIPTFGRPRVKSKEPNIIVY